jgi:hypothetical protein
MLNMFIVIAIIIIYGNVPLMQTLILLYLWIILKMSHQL